MVLKHYENFLKEAQKQPIIVLDKQKGKIIRRLASVRFNCENSIINAPITLLKDNWMMFIQKATKNLGFLFELLGAYKLSRKVYKTIHFVSTTCRLYERELSEFSKNQSEENSKKESESKLEYDQYKKEHLRESNHCKNVLNWLGMEKNWEK